MPCLLSKQVADEKAAAPTEVVVVVVVCGEEEWPLERCSAMEAGGKKLE